MDGLTRLWDAAGDIVRAEELARAAGWGFVLFLAVSVGVLLLELPNGAGRARFKSREFFNDVAYCLFYRGGFYEVFLWAAVANWLQYLGFLETSLLSGLPLWASIPLFWLLSDFIFYWLHRAQHRFHWLWVFHSVHHAERHLNSLSQMRRHPLEHAVTRFSRVFPLALVLGLPTASWIPISVAAQLLQALHHAELNWRFGPLYRLVVSPVFHSIHHSVEPENFNTNYGTMFSFWDFLFGTASRSQRRPEAYGIADFEMPESLLQQFVRPFELLFRGDHRNRVPEEPPREVTDTVRR